MCEVMLFGKRLRLPERREVAFAVSVGLLTIAAGIVASACASVIDNQADVAEPPKELS